MNTLRQLLANKVPDPCSVRRFASGFFSRRISVCSETTDMARFSGGRVPVRSNGGFGTKLGLAGLALTIAFLFPGTLVSAVLPGWVRMWLIVGACFASAKWITVATLAGDTRHFALRRLLAYLFLWPGLDARSFLFEAPVGKPAAREWASAMAKTALGAVLLTCAANLQGTPHPLLAGWLGMVGLVLLLHFGSFQVLSILWRTVGVNARPIMRSPLTATSLSEFWGGGWNAAFRDLMHEHVFKPVSRKVGIHRALLMVFVCSGLLHELAITVPAHGGYGLPTTYFLFQCAGIFGERSKIGRRLGLGHGPAGWCFMILFTGLPVYWLFPPVFIQNVIVPMLRTIANL